MENIAQCITLTSLQPKYLYLAIPKCWHKHLVLSHHDSFPASVLAYIAGLVQERCNSIAKALELRLSCTVSMG